MNQATLLTTVGCSGSLAAALLFNQPALAAPDAPQVLTGTENAAIAQTPSRHLDTTTYGYTSDESLSDALGCTCALCNTDRERPTTPPMQ